MKIPFWKHVLIYFWSILILSMGYTTLIVNGVGGIDMQKQNADRDWISPTRSQKVPVNSQTGLLFQWVGGEEEIQHGNSEFLSDRNAHVVVSELMKFAIFNEPFVKAILILIQDKPPDGLIS